VKPSITRKLGEVFGKSLKIVELKDIPIEIEYKTKESLGVDRVINAFGVKEIYSENALVVSAGTALVVDLLKGGIFKGGFITAGMGLKLKALAEATEGISEYSLWDIKISYGTSSEEAVVGGVVKEARALIEACLLDWGLKEVVITGGEGWLLKDLGKYDPLLSHRALIRLAGRHPAGWITQGT
jgi:type III pantothenate kinase